MKPSASIAMAAVVAVAAIAAGCGSSDNSSSTANLTKAEWVAKADAICAKGNQEINAAAREQFGNQKPTAADINQFATKTIIPNTQSQLDQIKALGAPSEIQGQVDDLVTKVQADIDKVKNDPTQLTNTSFADANAAAHALGLKTCGGGGG